MPEEAPIPADEAALESADTPRFASLLRKIAVTAVVTAVVVVECLVAYLYLPSAADTAAMAKAALAASAYPDQLEQPEDAALADQVEVDLGEFSLTASQPMTNTALRIDFQLWGTLDEENYDEFMELLEEKLHRFREQVIITVRSANVADYSDPQLGLIKRTLLQKTNAVLGKPLLRGVILDNFSFIEQ